MAKTRLKTNLFDHVVPKPGTYKATLVWQWLQQIMTSNDDTGLVVRTLKARMDMPNQFANMTQIQRYMRKAKIDEAIVQRVSRHMWLMYSQYRDVVLHGVDPNGTHNPWSNDIMRDPGTGPRLPKPKSRFLSR